MKKLIMFSILSFAIRSPAFEKAMHQYHCTSTHGASQVVLTVNVDNVDDKVMVQKELADIDRNYAGQTKGNLRFVYEESDEGVTEAIIQAQVVNGAPSGAMAIQNRSDDFSRTTYDCRIIH